MTKYQKKVKAGKAAEIVDRINQFQLTNLKVNTNKLRFRFLDIY